MEKLLDLFNEYNLSPEMTGGEICDTRTEDDRSHISRTDKAYIVSKDFGWIKWLVEKDKIDLGKLIMIKDKEQKAIIDIDNSRENTLLMLLAISDTPIDDLISYLK